MNLINTSLAISITWLFFMALTMVRFAVLDKRCAKRRSPRQQWYRQKHGFLASWWAWLVHGHPLR